MTENMERPDPTDQGIEPGEPSIESSTLQPHDSATGGQDGATGVVQDTITRPSVKNGFLALLAFSLVAVVAQYFAPVFDHQNANLVSLGAVGIGVLALLFQLQRHQAYLGRVSRIPLLVIGTLVLAGISLRFEGFSGEMLPQFTFRFVSEKERPLQEVAADQVSATEGVATPKQTPPSDVRMNSSQFLGSNRNGVFAERMFEIPSDPDQLEVLWDQGIGSGWSSFSVVGQLAVTLEQRNDQECLTCYELETGKLIWIRKHDGLHTNGLGGTGPRSTPTITGDRVYATTATGHLWCVGLTDGRVYWEKDLLALAGWDQSGFEQAAPWGHAGSPLLAGSLCVVPLGGPPTKETSASLIAFDAETGEERWRAGDDQLSYASPMLQSFDGTPLIVSVNETSVTGHQIETGAKVWEFSWPGSTNAGASCASAMAAPNNRVLVGKGYGGGSALIQVLPDNGGWVTKDVWRSSRVLKTKFNHTCVKWNVGFGLSNGSLQAVDLEEPRQLWLQPRRSRAGQGQVILVEDVLVVQDEAGDLVFVDASTESYNERLRVPSLDSKTWNVPTVAGNHVLVRNDRQAICYRLPQRTRD